MAWLVLGAAATYLVIDEATQGWGADTSTEGVYRAVDDECPDHVEYVVAGRAYLIDFDDRRSRRCLKPDGGSTTPQRVFYETADPANAVFTDPGGPGAVRTLLFVSAGVLAFVVMFVPLVVALLNARRRR